MKVRRLLMAFLVLEDGYQQVAGQDANTRITPSDGSKRKGPELDAEGGAGALSERTTTAVSAESCEGGSSGWFTTSKKSDRQSKRRYQNLARASFLLIDALGDRRQLYPTAGMGAGIT